ncbi:MAG: AAA domain-containing protein [Treponema sp.]|nr:AAA domain-containing protein [Treponema sp.]
MANENVNYWIITHTYENAGQENMDDLISQALENKYAFMQYEYNFQESAMVTNVYNQAKEIKVGDYIFLRDRNAIYAYGKAIHPRERYTQKRNLQNIIDNRNSDLTSKNSSDIVHFYDAPVFYFDFSEGGEGNKWGQRIDVDNWMHNDTELNKPDSSDYADSNIRCPIRKLKEKTAKKLIKQLGGKITMPQNENPYKNEIELLRFKKNIILQGAPGTGKTYSTASIALGILGDDSVDYGDHKSVMQAYKKYCDDGRIGFVTFHQSMDYEDFVEGLKPEIIGDEQKCVNYKIEDGIFKRMCRNAEKSMHGFSAQDNFDSAWEQLIDYLNENDFIEVPLISGKKMFRMELNGSGNGLRESIQGTFKFFNKEQLYNIYRGLPGVPAHGHDNYRKAIVNYMKEHFSLKEYKKDSIEEMNNSDTQPYILIIDEINRGNVSKIFGELITLLEADKRAGETHPLEVTLPYSKELFSVPSNLYVIGTMNTTDRSVGNIDYAVRRRFAFVTLKADKSKLEQYYEKYAGPKEKACSLFDEIKSFLEAKKSDMNIDDLMAGHSYFMAENESQLEMKLEYEIIPLIAEYVKDGIIYATDSDFQKAAKEWKNLLNQ